MHVSFQKVTEFSCHNITFQRTTDSVIHNFRHAIFLWKLEKLCQKCIKIVFQVIGVVQMAGVSATVLDIQPPPLAKFRSVLPSIGNNDQVGYSF